MEHCPVCRARFSGDPICRRCKSDLASLVQLEEQAEYSLHQAMNALTAGDIDKAHTLCRHAVHYKRTPFSDAFVSFLAAKLDK